MERRIEKLDSEIDDLTAKIKVAQEDWLRAQDAQERADLEKIYEDLKKEKQVCRSERHDLQLKLPSSGERGCTDCLCRSSLRSCRDKCSEDSWPEQFRSY